MPSALNIVAQRLPGGARLALRHPPAVDPSGDEVHGPSEGGRHSAVPAPEER